MDLDIGSSCWFDVSFRTLNATLFCSYYEMNAERTYEKLVEDAYTMVSKHNPKATFRDEQRIEREDGSHGMIFLIDGPVASPYQFYLTDSTRHFLRGSFYFDNKVQRDSIEPVLEFIMSDIERMIATVDWQ